MRRFSISTWVFILLLGLGLMAAVNSFRAPAPSASPAMEAAAPPVPKKMTEEEKEDAAIGACEFFVQHSLNDPGSADFDHSSTFSVKNVKGVYHVTLGLRARNAYNALVWGQYDCEVIQAGDSWLPLKIRQRL